MKSIKSINIIHYYIMEQKNVQGKFFLNMKKNISFFYIIWLFLHIFLNNKKKINIKTI